MSPSARTIVPGAHHSLGDLELERLRQLVQMEGPATSSDDELLALVFGRRVDGSTPLFYAQNLLRECGGLSNLAKLPSGGLLKYAGLGVAQATRISATFELGRRAARDSTRLSPRVPLTKERVADWARTRLAGLDHEEVWVLCVDAQSVHKSSWQVGRGGVHGCALLARDLLTPVVRDAASGFVLVHNHPSGDPTPSQEDIELTRGLQAAATTICVPLLDHVVVASGGARSFFELGLL